MLHGNAESSAVWFGWIPYLARHYRIIRPDMRGFGDSTPMQRDFNWSLDTIINDYMILIEKLGIERFHLIGAKLGGTIARRFAACRPERVISLTVAGTPPPFRNSIKKTRPLLVKEFESENGVESWARRTMSGRLGSGFSNEGIKWWTSLMGKTAASTQIGFCTAIPTSDITADLPLIRCQTLVITTEGSALGTIEETRTWQKMIPNSRLIVLPGNSYHVAASDPDICAKKTLEFICGIK
jgi:hypothetical protein